MALTSPRSVSVVVPLCNEEENVGLLYEELDAVLSNLDREYEIVFVDDGSSDKTVELCREIAANDWHVRLVLFRRNFGQSAAMQAGIDHARCDVIVTLDGDLQNDPADIPAMLAKIDEGYDLVHGWRKERQDTWLDRKLPSQIANWLISKVTGFEIHDLGCTLKAIRREVAQELELYGEMHRFIPILAHARGAKCVEVETHHRARQFGQTKYGISRTFRVLLDLITVKFLLDYSASPMKLFGGIGLLCGALGVGSACGTVLMKGLFGTDMTGNPLLLLTVLSMILGVQFLSLGLLGEVAARIYLAQPGHRTYAVRELVNCDESRDLERDEQPSSISLHRAA